MQRLSRILLDTSHHRIALASRITARGLHCQSYTPSSITQALRNSASLRDAYCVKIGPADYRNEHPISGDDDKTVIYHIPDRWNPSSVLRELEAVPNIQQIIVDLDHILYHAATSETIKEGMNGPCPEQVLDMMGFNEFEATGLCRWTSDAWPKFIIEHFPARAWLNQVMPFTDTTTDWAAFLQSQVGNPEFQAFHYTADFYSKDLRYLESGGEYVDLGPYGAGSYICGFASLGIEFYNAMMHNTATFSRCPGVSSVGLYRQFMDRGGASCSPRYSQLCRIAAKKARSELSLGVQEPL
ncbi:MAG: hypothetical protein LQ346_004969 [Caloplaca aetnensis]|nr:MAG: hypothetical protein LQ346_004969 [Caloplaca aetnensis]